MQKIRLGILLPTNNEALCIQACLCDIEKTYTNGMFDTTVFVLDNLSNDNTMLEVADYIKKSNMKIICLNNDRVGKSEVLLDNMNKILSIRCDYYILTDSDNTYNVSSQKIESIIKDMMVNNIEYGVGERIDVFKQHEKYVNKIGNIVFTKIFNHVAKKNQCKIVFNDCLTGFRVFSRELIIKLFNCPKDNTTPKGFELEAYLNMYSIKNQLPCISFGVNYNNRQNGSKSKLRAFTDGCKILKYVNLLNYVYFSDSRPKHLYQRIMEYIFQLKNTSTGDVYEKNV